MKEVKGTILHRILLNYRIDPAVMAKNLPAGFKPQLVNGYAIGGICQVSLSEMRPKGLPAIIGTSSHNAAHRVAVETSQGRGVFVTRRDTNSTLNTLTGGRLFPGFYDKVDFRVESNDPNYFVEINTKKEHPLMLIKANVGTSLNSTSIFENVEAISDFFKGGNIGWSANAQNNGYDAIELKTLKWEMLPLNVTEQYSAYFDNLELYPKGSVEFDSAMIMRYIEHSWISRENLCEVCS